ncbi:type II toxin-antitoxin system RelE/ParE family toxin [candidate division KSB1 bacterium]|nr:type II toxin-antitoxin system RelE/ParE family toxin [candidate division KSB1 bacterium]
MTYNVYIVKDAEEDLYELYRYIATYDSSEKAEKVLMKIEEACKSLLTFPLRGHVLPELERIGVLEYRQLISNPYRIIYEIKESAVYIHSILHSQRNLSELLEKRLLR